MALMVKYDDPRFSREDYEAVRAKVDWDNGPPAGCLLHMAAFDASGAHTVDIWETRVHLDAYLAGRFAPALKALHLPAVIPEITDLQVVAVSPNIEEYFIKAPAIG